MVCGQRPPSPSTTVYGRSHGLLLRSSLGVPLLCRGVATSSRRTGTLIAPPHNHKVLASLAFACIAAIIPLHHRPPRLGLAVSPSRLVSAISSFLILLHLLLVVMSAPISLAPGGSSSRISARAGLEAATERTRQPIVTGTSVLGIKYKDGVMLAATPSSSTPTRTRSIAFSFGICHILVPHTAPPTTCSHVGSNFSRSRWFVLPHFGQSWT